jgi:hypothetical protein
MTEHRPSFTQHIINVWERFLQSNEAKKHPELHDTLKNFLNRAYLMEVFTPSPELHFVGNIFAHFLKNAAPSHFAEPIDSYHIFQLHILLGLTWLEIINLLHNMHVLISLLDTAQTAWRDIQITRMQIPIPFSIMHAEPLSQLLLSAAAWQDFLNKNVSNYGRKLVFTFRLAHAQYHPDFLPQLAWDPPDSNDWAKGFDCFMHIINSKQHLIDFIEECNYLLQLKYYGHRCDSSEVIQYCQGLKTYNMASIFGRLKARAESAAL